MGMWVLLLRGQGTTVYKWQCLKAVTRCWRTSFGRFFTCLLALALSRFCLSGALSSQWDTLSVACFQVHLFQSVMHLQLKQTSQVCAQVYLFIITVWLAIHQEKECPWSAPPAVLDAGELQIALLECAMEYELKVSSALLCLLLLQGLLRHFSSLELSMPSTQWKHIASLTIIGVKTITK